MLQIKLIFQAASALLFLLLFQNTHAAMLNQCISYHTVDKHIHIAKVNLNCDGIRLITTSPQDRGMTVSQFAQRYQTDIAINGSFFRKGFYPFGLTVSDYTVWPKERDVTKRVFLACDNENNCAIEPVNTVSKLNKKWRIALSGWQSFNAKTNRFECSSDDKIGCTHIKFVTPQPRTLIGLDQNTHSLYMVVVDGRLPGFQGLTLNELGKLAASLHMTQAINLDGGGSSTMLIGNTRISTLSNRPAKERVVANHFGIRYKK